ncbi:hypothetical protein B0I37DRAFT_162406 [Chaetomium sp. MPI-CAGE-AT-0009]|nr:hypothetical protein B0I37DRAFT_162406 [Chaetomium sp. MPI-CAGE-AT-0009]
MAFLGCLFLVSLLSAASGVRAEDARIAPASQVTEWELNSLMHLQLTAPETEALRLTYSVYPLTEPAGLNRSDRSSIWIRGSLIPAEVLADADLMSEETIVFFNCDGENATRLVNQVMADQPRAILLYSVDGASCSLEGDDLIYNSIYTMGDPNEARDTMNNTVRAGGVLRATITGGENMTRTGPDDPEQHGGNSAVAMSILYSITGLITLLFLVIIGTGAIRAHRYPERYGPMTGSSGRPSQSRVKGLARAVLDTLPIVKFGDPGPAKPDPSLELESQSSATAPDPTMGTRLSAIPEEPRTPQARRSAAPMSGAIPQPEVAPAPTGNETDHSRRTEAERDGNKPAESPEEGHLGCSICTEDFTLGEDVRVLPCNHKFHPPCIDPWLVNISGTCPLCRLDLHPQSRRARNSSHSNPSPPSSPTTATGNRDGDEQHDTTATTTTTTAATAQQRRRSFRFLDLHRLRHASSIEERIEILRHHRSHQQRGLTAAATEGTGDGTAEEGVVAPETGTAQQGTATGTMAGERTGS